MTSDKIRLIVIYLIVILFVGFATLGQYPFSITALTISIITAIFIAKAIYISDAKRFIVYGILWSIICITIFASLLVIGFKLDVRIIKNVMEYTL